MKIELTEQQWNVVGQALTEVPMPYKFTAPILAEIQRQIVEAKNEAVGSDLQNQGN